MNEVSTAGNGPAFMNLAICAPFCTHPVIVAEILSLRHFDAHFVAVGGQRHRVCSSIVRHGQSFFLLHALAPHQRVIALVLRARVNMVNDRAMEVPVLSSLAARCDKQKEERCFRSQGSRAGQVAQLERKH